MNKVELIGAMAEKAEISKKDAENALAAFTKIITNSLINENMKETRKII